MPDALSAAHLSRAVVPLTTEPPARALRKKIDRINTSPAAPALKLLNQLAAGGGRKSTGRVSCT